MDIDELKMEMQNIQTPTSNHSDFLLGIARDSSLGSGS